MALNPNRIYPAELADKIKLTEHEKRLLSLETTGRSDPLNPTTIAQIPGLQSILDAKADDADLSGYATVSHTHAQMLIAETDTYGDGVTTTFVISLVDIVDLVGVFVIEEATGMMVLPDIYLNLPTANDITIEHSLPPLTDEYRYQAIGRAI